MKTIATTIEWHEHPKLAELEKWVQDKLPWDLQQDFAEKAYKDCESLHDFIHTASNWVNEQKEKMDKLMTMIHLLPDLKDAMIEVDENT